MRKFEITEEQIKCLNQCSCVEGVRLYLLEWYPLGFEPEWEMINIDRYKIENGKIWRRK